MEHISDKVVDLAVQDIQEAISGTEDEIGTVGVVRGGKLQDNPVKAHIAILVHIGDPEKTDSWYDSSTASSTGGPKLERWAADVPAFEIGGGSLQWRRFSAEIGIYEVKRKLARDEARRVANVVRGLVERAIAKSSRIRGAKDDFGEIAMIVNVTGSRITEGGGPPASFIWRGLVYFQVLTGRDY